jgi:O-antigen/teichoic acid export membrane protein
MSESVKSSTPTPKPRHDTDTVSRGAALALAAKLSGGVFTAALTIFLARKLGSHTYGVFALALSIIALVELPCDLGVGVALPRFLAEHRSDPGTVQELLRDGMALEAVGAWLTAAILAALAGIIAGAYHAPSLATPLRVLAIALVGQKFLFFFLGVFSALRRQALNLCASLVESAAELSATVALVAILGGATAAASGRAVGYAIGALAGLAFTIRLVGSAGGRRFWQTHGHARAIVRYGWTLSIIDAVFTIFTQIDVLLIGAFLTAGSVAFFQAPMRLITMLQYPGAAIAVAVSPLLVRSATQLPDVQAFNRSVRLLTILMVGVTAFTTVWATPIIHLALGSGYDQAVPVLRALAPYVFLSGGAALVSGSLNYLGAGWRRLPIALLAVTVNLTLDVGLLPRIGVIGGAIGSDVAFAIYVVVQFMFCATVLGIPLKPHAITLVRSLLAVAPMALVLAAFGTGRISPLRVGVGAVAGIGAYGVGLLAVRELSLREVRRAADMVFRSLHARSRS